jgi:hypothetical protein
MKKQKRELDVITALCLRKVNHNQNQLSNQQWYQNGSTQMNLAEKNI